MIGKKSSRVRGFLCLFCVCLYIIDWVGLGWVDMKNMVFLVYIELAFSDDKKKGEGIWVCASFHCAELFYIYIQVGGGWSGFARGTDRKSVV